MGAEKNFTGVEVRGKQLGVIRMGRIGTEVAKRGMMAMGMSILAYDPLLREESSSLELASPLLISCWRKPILLLYIHLDQRNYRNSECRDPRPDEKGRADH